MAKNENRGYSSLNCTECGKDISKNYTTTKNKKNNPERLELKKHCKKCNKHTLHKEEK